MNSTFKQIIVIVCTSTVLGLLRFFMISDNSFTIIKKPRLLDEAKAEINDLGDQVFSIPEFMTEPMMASLEFAKYFFYRESAVFIDARESVEFKINHISNAINIPFDYYDEYMDLIDSLDHNIVYIIYCSGGECSLSLDLADFLFNKKGFQSVFVFEGGLPAWEEAGLPIEND